MASAPTSAFSAKAHPSPRLSAIALRTALSPRSLTLSRRHASAFPTLITHSRTLVVSATATEMPQKAKGFVDEMRAVAMKLHTRDQAKEGQKEPQGQPVAKWEPTIEGYLKFLVDSKLVYDTLDSILHKAPYQWCKLLHSLLDFLLLHRCSYLLLFQHSIYVQSIIWEMQCYVFI